MSCLLVLFFNTLAFAAQPAQPPAPIKAGLIGLDTSHVIAYAKLLNDPLLYDRADSTLNRHETSFRP